MNYLFVGASSDIAINCADVLVKNGHTVIGLSRETVSGPYSELLVSRSYQMEDLPQLEGPLDGLVYFPGTVNLKPFHRLSRADFLNDLEINFLGAVAATQCYLPLLQKGSLPSIVYISSVAAQLGLPMHASISAAKAALEGLTRSMAAELAPAVRVNCIAPSLVNTSLTQKFTNTPEKMEAMANRNPLKKVGSCADIANMIEFLLSDKSAWITGQVISVDGGMGVLKP